MRKEFHAWKIDGKVFISYEAVAEVGRRAAAAGAHGACCAKIIELPNNAKQQEARIEAHAAIPYVRTRYVRHISSFPPYLCIFPPYLNLSPPYLNLSRRIFCFCFPALSFLACPPIHKDPRRSSSPQPQPHKI